MVAVVPVATSIARVYPFQVVLRARQAGLRRDSGALAEQVSSVTVERIGSSVGEAVTQRNRGRSSPVNRW